MTASAQYCNITGIYHGAAHPGCAKKYQQVVIPVIAHNFRGYDGHFVITALADPTIQRLIGDHAIDGIPTNTEKFMSLTIRRQLKFIDSMQFMSTSIEQLVKNCSEFPALDKHFGDKSSMMRRKGIFPYEYITDYSRLEQRSLPSHDKFYSTLHRENVSDDDYNNALKVFAELGCSTIGDYYDAYLIQDVLLLSDIMDQFRKSSMQAYRLDPCWYVSSPGLAWDAMLKMTQIELELITEPDKYQFVEHSIYGGISVITKKKSIASNKYIPDDFRADDPVSYLIYLDSNNLYEWAMSKRIPDKITSWYNEDQFNAVTKNCTKDSSDADYSFFVECDVDYPVGIHDEHNDYPFLAEKMSVTDSLLSPVQLSTIKNKTPSHEKLVPTLLPKRNYICHYRALQQAVQAGLVVTRVHRALKFHQCRWLARYIEYNTDMRSCAVNDFQKDFFKLMNNSVFGKTMENVRNRCNIELVNNNTKRFSKLISSNDYNGRITIKDNLVFVKRHCTDILLAKPIYVGASVLDISKTLMYDFHYGFIKKEYPDARLCFSDTDSLLYEIPGRNCNDDLYSSLYQHRNLFDLSDVDGEFNDNTNKIVIGKFKDELCFKPIKKFIGLRPKMYSVLAADPNHNMVKSKGVKKSVVRKTFTHELYQLVHSGKLAEHTASMTVIQSRLHQLSTATIIKSGLINFDDKRYCNDNINTYAIGHYRNSIPELSP